MKKGLRRVAAVAVTALVVAPALATVASATSTFAFDRLAGTDRYGTSVKVAAEFGASTDVILASGVPGHYPDALTASYLAGFKKAPIMLTQLAATPTNVVDRITASGATNVWLIGGTGVISAAQEAALDAKFGTVTRLGGLDRYLTAEKVIGAAGVAKSTTAVLATGSNFPDAIAGGPLSYVKGMPLAITATNSVPAATLRALKAAGTTKVIVLGGPTIITPAVLTTLAAQTPSITLDQRIFGANRSETSSKLADYMLTSQGFSNTGVNVASGYGFGTGADALGGAPLSGKENRPTLITESVTTVGPGPLGYLKAHANTLASGHIFGGLGAVAQSAEDAMEAAARTVTSNQTFTVTPATAATVDTAVGTRAYTVSGLNNALTYDLALFACANVDTSTPTVKFLNSTNPGGTGNVALQGTTAATITVINGVAVTAANLKTGVSPSGGQITFTVTDTTAGNCVVPVVYGVADGNDLLNLGTNNQPTDFFGIGGATTFITPAVAGVFGGYVAATGAAPTSVVAAASGDTFTVTALGTFTYKTTDNFFVYDSTKTGAAKYVASTYAVFHLGMSVGDNAAGIYQPTGTSTFVLDDAAPVAVTGLAQQTADGVNLGKAGIQIGWNDTVNGTVDSYNVYRATATQPAITGQPVTCPTAASFAKIGNVLSHTATAYSFFDGSALVPPTATPQNPEYCYQVKPVDATGGEGAMASVGPLAADAALAAAGTPTFVIAGTNSANGAGGTYIMDVTYSTAAVGAVVANGSDFTASYYGLDGIGHLLTVTGATVAGNVVTITATQGTAPTASVANGHVIVTAKAGTDLNTVSDNLTVPKFQAVGDQLFITT